MKCIKERYLQAFSIWNSILHTPYFARGAYTKDDMHYYSSKQKGYNDRDRNICKFNEKWERANKYFDAAIEYLKDAFLLVSYMELEFYDYLKMNKDDTARPEKLRKIADYLDELLSRNIRNFIIYYYMLDEKSICKAEYIVPKCEEYHYQHEKYFGMNDIESYVKEHLFNNLYTQ